MDEEEKLHIIHFGYLALMFVNQKRHGSVIVNLRVLRNASIKGLNYFEGSTEIKMLPCNKAEA